MIYYVDFDTKKVSGYCKDNDWREEIKKEFGKDMLMKIGNQKRIYIQR